MDFDELLEANAAMNILKVPYRYLIIENFQSHKKTEVEFAPAGGLTVLAGKSRSGKTAIIRALRWLIYNAPTGVNIPSKNDKKTGYCRVGASFIRVTLVLANGTRVIRERTRSLNQYKIIRPNATEPEVFEGFGTGVPWEVQQVTGVWPIRIGDLQFFLNLSEQLDGPFLGSKQVSRPDRAMVLGELAGMEQVDYANKMVGTDLHRRTREADRLKEDVVELDKQVKKYDYLPQLKKRINELEKLLAKMKELSKRRYRAWELLRKIADFNRQIDGCDRTIKRWRNLPELEIRVNELRKICDRSRKAHETAAKVNFYRLHILTCEKVITRYQHIDAAESYLLRISELAARRRETARLTGQLQKAGRELKEAEKIIRRWLYLPEAEDVLKLMVEKAKRRRQAVELQAKVEKTNKTLNREEKTLRRLRGLPAAEKLHSEMVALVEKRARAARLTKRIETFMEKINDEEKIAEQEEKKVVKLQEKYRQTLVAVKVCPTCGAGETCPACGEKIMNLKRVV